MGSATLPISRAVDSISNLIKPWVRPWYSQLVLNPSVKLLLNTTTVGQAYGSNHPRHSLPPETIVTPEVEKMPPFDEPFEYLKGGTYTSANIYSTVVENVLFEPGNGVVLTSSRQILAESLYPHMDLITVAGAFLNKSFIRRKFTEAPVETIPGYSSIYQGLPNGYYHKIIDLVPRCFLLNNPAYAQIDEIKLLYAEPLAEVEQLMVPKLVPANVKRVRLEPGRLYRLEKLILPTFLTQFGSGYLPAAYLQKVREMLLPKRPSKKCHRIYISRAKSASGQKKRHILNEPELFAALKSFGFQRYCLEDYSLEEKIELFYDAETVVGAYGGGLTHILFSEKINVLELQIMAKMQTYYYYLNKALGHNFRFICADKANNRENFSVNIDQVVEILAAWQADSAVSNYG
ncbi:MAG: glycosyltransferase family 61 protein [Leptolyngbyaceae cyanobacterium SM1_1_3]|nr:glycosyltransferase family 61 protein [Leptolyngbyaceae cyanobacterium SM1_1_3]NJN02937.1 glycosyltransferase family 61 protein [Leptolyngbyaceae cyanobacterium RM1_1_2]NJO08860.1 glycosyltransferase family 61 protein [Leptolyngbyaceae cyanobacterium SL_1_1]